MNNATLVRLPCWLTSLRRGAPPVALLVCLLMFRVVPARAGAWEQVLCENPNGSAAPLAGLTYSVGNAQASEGGAQVQTDCDGNLTASTGGVFLSVTGSGPMPQSWSQAIYAAPAGSLIVGGTIAQPQVEQNGWGGLTLSEFDAWISASGNAPNDGDPSLTCESGTTQALSACAWGDSAGPLYTEPLPKFDATHIYMTAGCSLDNTDSCPSSSSGVFAALVSWMWIDVLLSDNTPPTAADFGGSLLAPGSVSGTADLSFTANDMAGPGVYNVTVQIDGNIVYSATPAANGGECFPVGTDADSGALMFDYQQPCPASEQVDIPIDTSKLANGIHQLRVSIEDAARNVSTVLNQGITTQNATTASPTGSDASNPTSAGGQPNGSTGEPPPSARIIYAFELNRASAKLVGRTIRRSYLGSNIVLSGAIVNPAGAPAPGVSVRAEAGSVSGHDWRKVGATMTDGAGRFALAIPRGDSRAVRLVVGARSVSFRQYVRPNISLKVRSLRGQRLVFAGRVAIARDGSPRPLVELADRGSAGWQALANITVSKDGRYRYVYVASPLAKGRSFQIRASTSATAFWQGSSSGAISVKVI